MSQDQDQRLAALTDLDEDLFDFPDVEGMSDLIAASREENADGPAAPLPAPAAPAQAAGAPSAPVAPAGADEPVAPLPRTAERGDSTDPGELLEGDELDEDLFGFGDLYDLGGELPAREAAPAAPEETPFDVPAAAAPATPAPSPPAPAAPAPAAAAAAPAPAPARTPAPTPAPALAPAPAAVERPAPRAADESVGARPAPAPVINFGVETDLPPARSKFLWVLVACFLLANTGVFLLTQQQNRSVNDALMRVTSTLADAVTTSAGAAPREIIVRNAPTTEVRSPERSASAAPDYDPALHRTDHELGVLQARRLIEIGEYAEARRVLFSVLANQSRGMPLSPELRESIDFLIPLTFYDQGRTVATEGRR